VTRRIGVALRKTLCAGAAGWLLGSERCALLAYVDFMQLSKIRGAANGKLETSRGRKSGPKSIIREEKKGVRSLMLVFKEMQVVTGFSGETLTRSNRRVSRYNSGIK